jgi:hypothetical protein
MIYLAPIAFLPGESSTSITRHAQTKHSTQGAGKETDVGRDAM